MSSKILHLAVGSRDLSQAEKKLLLLQAEKIHRMTIMFTQNGQSRRYSQLEINHVIQQPSEES